MTSNDTECFHVSLKVNWRSLPRLKVADLIKFLLLLLSLISWQQHLLLALLHLGGPLDGAWGTATPPVAASDLRYSKSCSRPSELSADLLMPRRFSAFCGIAENRIFHHTEGKGLRSFCDSCSETTSEEQTELTDNTGFNPLNFRFVQRQY